MAPGHGEARQWFALHTRSRHEEVVRGRLTAKGIETFLPQAAVWSRRADRRKVIEAPLFRGYLFVRVAMGRPVWAQIVRTPGVVRVLGNSEGCLPVPEAQIDSVRALVAGTALPRLHPYLTGGRRVRVASGPLTGCEGVLVRRRGRGGRRLVIAVDIIRQAVCAELEAADVEPL